MSDTVTKRYVNRQRGYDDPYTIEFRKRSGFIQLHAIDRPHDPHRNKDEAHVALDGTLICVSTGKEPRTLERAEAIAHAWMLGYSVYVRTGKFPKGPRSVSV